MHRQNRPFAVDVTTKEGMHTLEAWLPCRLGNRVQHLKLIIDEQGLVLRGKAQSYHAKQQAQHEVMAATRMPILANNIEVV